MDYVRQTAASVRNRQGSEDLRPQRLPDRALCEACHRFLCGQSQAGAAARELGRLVHRHRHRGLLPGLCLYRLAHACGRILGRRSYIPGGLVPAPAHSSRRAARQLLVHGEPGALSQRPVLLLRGRAGNPVAGKSASLPAADRPRLRVRRCWLHVSRCRALGGAQSQLHAQGGRSAGAGRRKRRRQDHAW